MTQRLRRELAPSGFPLIAGLALVALAACAEAPVAPDPDVSLQGQAATPPGLIPDDGKGKTEDLHLETSEAMPVQLTMDTRGPDPTTSEEALAAIELGVHHGFEGEVVVYAALLDGRRAEVEGAPFASAPFEVSGDDDGASLAAHLDADDIDRYPSPDDWYPRPDNWTPGGELTGSDQGRPVASLLPGNDWHPMPNEWHPKPEEWYPAPEEWYPAPENWHPQPHEWVVAGVLHTEDVEVRDGEPAMVMGVLSVERETGKLERTGAIVVLE